MAKILGLVPARGGSKGVLRKNIREVCGRPLLAYTAEAAACCARLDRIVLSTDDEEIAEVGRACGIDVPFLRPAVLACDTASSIGVIKHALSWLANAENYHPEIVVFLPPTTPLRTSAQIEAAIDLLESSGKRSVVSVRPVIDHPYAVFRCDDQGGLQPAIEMENRPLRRQDMPPFYVVSQAVIAVYSDYVEQAPDPAPCFDLTSVAGLPIDALSSTDIDTPEDLARVEALIAQRLRTGMYSAAERPQSASV